VAAVVCPFEFDDDQASFVVDAQEVDPASGILEVPEFLGDYEQSVSENLNVGAQCSLQMRPLEHSFSSEGGRRNGR
jgi:hypothetical protein